MLVPARSDAAVAARTFRAGRVASVSTETWLVAGLIVLGAVLRFTTLGAQSYWYDEAQAAHELHLSLGSMLSSMVDVETAPPLYFVLGWAWAHVFGAGEVALRSLSALSGTALIGIAYLCGRELISRRAGLLTAAFVAVSPFMIWYSQEAREYMLVAALCGASLLCFVRASRSPSARNLAWWAGFSVLALLTHYFAGFLIGPQALWLLYRARSRASAVAVAVVGLVELALIPLLVSHATASLLGFITGTHLSTRVQAVPVAFALGPPFAASALSYGLIGAAVLGAVLIVLLIVGAEPDELRGVTVAAVLAAAVLLVPLVLALLGEDYYIERALIPAWLPLAIVLAAGCTTRRLRVPGAVLAGIVLAGFAYGVIRIATDRQYQRPDWRGVAEALGSASTPRAVVAYDGLATDPLKLYLRGVPWTTPDRPVSVNEVDVVGYRGQTLADSLPPGVRVLATRRLDDYFVVRFWLSAPWRLPPSEIGSRAAGLLAYGPPAQVVLLQSPRLAG
ncbi:MAG TPA: glycosyltransferase family 39 protein [Solirubrobacteraceae bacterium]|nr:glycosyltransferase family 39 protein [Solirubrobacteraceae bacterium]